MNSAGQPPSTVTDAFASVKRALVLARVHFSVKIQCLKDSGGCCQLVDCGCYSEASAAQELGRTSLGGE